MGRTEIEGATVMVNNDASGPAGRSLYTLAAAGPLRQTHACR
jgi:hypothetical protein